MPIYKIQAGRIITVESSTWVGPEGTIWYDEILGDLRIGDGYTPGGRLISTSGAIGYTGSQGNTGTQGITGYTGSTGTQGIIGYTGSTGTQGEIGFTGSTGTQGLIGFTGSTGTQGVIGFSGSQGDKGDQGLQGTTGTQGPRGFTGEQGISVTLIGSTSTVGGLPAIGNPGDGWIVEADGDLYFWNTITSTWNNVGQIVGPQGAEGLQGNMGPQGPQGNTGTQGPIGFTGSTGTQGITGYTGSTGTQGEIGFTGSTGTQGITGYTGSTGTQGLIGFTGSTGTQGLIGYTGSTGTQGEIGFTGSTGTQGLVGFTGSTGTQGEIGFTGSTGTQGPLGYTGSFGLGLTTDQTSTVTLSTGFKFIPETDGIQDLGSLTNRFGKIFLAGQTIDLGGTILSVDPNNGGLIIKNSAGELETVSLGTISIGGSLTLASSGTSVSLLATGTNLIIDASVVNVNSIQATGTVTLNSIKVGSTSTTSGVTITVDQYDNILFTSANGTILNGYTGSRGTDGVIGYNGSVGFTGSIGSTGTQGEIGYTGSTGTQGVVGFTGSTGTQGPIGFTGSQGIVSVGTGLVYTTSTGNIYLDSTIVTTTGTQTLTNKTIIVPSGGALYFDDDVALSQIHGATIPYQQTSAAPRMYTNADFNTGILWKDAGEFNPDDGWNVIDSVADSSYLPVGYTGAVYDAYITLDNNHLWYWAALNITDLKPGDYYYDDVNFTINICFVYLNPDSGNLTYAMLDLTPR